ncbi:hypothetical protein [Alteromonas gilva]|uniref:Uncharacterized protein n=1 Tax=Alteromonas gilva TaxID=2987522 RepID=A0ABT5KWR8_9ALTE|nr:hypothetical protein [Alteromonas gilva]MDC8829215.1 hypothetical protein [Alteromonas gilva]
MRLFNKLLLVHILMISVGLPVLSEANHDIEDKIYIAQSDGKVTAVVSGVKSDTFRLKPKERVLWRNASGYLGAVLTDAGFNVISVSSNYWNNIRLSPYEIETATASVSPFIALLVTEDRAIGYNIATDSFYEVRLPLYDSVIAVKSAENVAVVVTSGTLLGLQSKSSYFTEARLKIGETVENVHLTDNNVTVQTRERLYTFTSTGSGWQVTDLD